MLNLRNFSTLMLITTLSGCASSGGKSKAEFANQAWDGKTSSEKIKTNLTKSMNLVYKGPSGFALRAYLVSRALIEAEAHELGEKKASSPAETQKDVKAQLATLAETRTCFMLTAETSTIGEAQFKHWHGRLELPDGTKWPVEFMSTKGVSSVPSAGTLSFGSPYRFYNSSLACTQKPLPLVGKMKLLAGPSFKSSPVAELQWDI